jgi:dimethylhistidine N-methyltransferase
MSLLPRSERIQWIDLHPRLSSFLEDAKSGLAAVPKWLSAKYFYDARGSELFEDITRLPEYYLTRTELGMLHEHAPEIARLLGEDFALIEFGSGSSTKVRLILDQVTTHGTYMPIDISKASLAAGSETIGADYPDIEVVAVCADYSRAFELPDPARYRRRVVFFPGSTIGNFDKAEAAQFFRDTDALLLPSDAMIVGVDLKKDAAILNAAYNDAAGVTAAFNLNLLHRMNRELGADFDPSRFAHEAFYNEEAGRIEMHLRSQGEQLVHLGGATFHFDDGETIHTESSYKYTVDDFRQLLEGTRFELTETWIDEARLFSVHSLEVSD